jgi:acetyl esterase
MGLRHKILLAATRGALRVPQPVWHVAANLVAAAPSDVDGRRIDGLQRLSCALVQWSDPPADDDIDAFRRRVRMSTLGLGPPPLSRKRCETVDADGVTCTVYRPRRLPNRPALLVFFHGGGGVLGDLRMYDGVCSGLARQGRCMVASVDYRLAPEHPFPAGLDDCERAYRALRAMASGLGADPARVAVAGDSMGGNLAAAVVLRCADAPPWFAWLAYPWTDLRVEAPSTQTLARGYGLTTPAIEWFRSKYIGEAPAERVDLAAWETRVDAASPGRAPSLDGFCPTYVFTAGFDPLRDEGRSFADRLKAAGVEVEYACFDDQVHGFLSVAGAVPSARRAFLKAAGPLRAGVAET